MEDLSALLSSLNESQRRAVTYGGRHLLVLAGAGTGKTRTIVARAAYLIATGADPAKMQIVTFTRRAAAEIVSRVRSELPRAAARALRGSTFHSWCSRMLSESPNLFGTRGFTVIDEDDQHALMKMACGGKSVSYENARIKPLELLEFYSFARNTGKNLTEMLRVKVFNNDASPGIAGKLAAFRGIIKPIYEAYEEKKRERRYLDYDDMLHIVSSRLKESAEARAIIAAGYEHILVDEMQDTNPLQWELLAPFQDCCSLFCVGDDAQSIYSFRGADFRNIHSFTERVPGAEVCRLEDNYRSTQGILDAANWLLAKSPLGYNKKLRAVRGPGEPPAAVNTRSDWDEAAWVADTIAENYSHNGKTYKDHLILVRSLSYSRALQAVLLQRRIPYVTYGGYKFMEAAHIKDVMSALRVVNNPRDDIAWMRFLTLWQGVGEARGASWTAAALALDSAEARAALFERAAFNDDTRRICGILRGVEAARGEPARALSRAFGAMEARLAETYRADWEQKRRADFPVLEALAGNYGTLGEFITECILDTSPAVSDSPILTDTDVKKKGNQDCVVISTVHSAKGLEADTCFVLNVSPRAYPASWAVDNLDQVEEERRGLYVAMTRAQKALFITRNLHSVHASDRFARQKTVGGKTIEEHYFLNGMPAALFRQITPEGEGATGRDAAEPNELPAGYGMDFS